MKTQFGWYVFEVTKITPASQQSLEQATETIKNLLRSQRQQKTLDDSIKNFREDYKDKTHCATDYEWPSARTAPKRAPTPARRRVAHLRAQRPAPSAADAAASAAGAPDAAVGGADARRGRVGAALARLDEITRLLRRECPWDREQDERSIVPHTVEEAYELADAAQSGDDAQAARRARRRAVPGLLPLAAARGARRRATSPRSPSTAARS